MATTTNYSWVTPDDTALVKDGAAAIRTLGSSADTTTKNLNPETTLGDLAFRSSTANVKTRLGLGTAGQILAVNSGANAPEWVTPAPAGGITLIQETEASTLSSLSFTGISGSFKQLLLMYHGVQHSTTGSEFVIRFNNNAGQYEGNALMERSGVLAANNYWTSTAIQLAISGQNIAPFGFQANNSSYYHWAKGSLLIDNYASATKYKFFSLDCSYYNNAGSAGWVYARGQGTWVEEAAITSIDIVRIGGSATFSNAPDTSIRLYGLS